MVLAITTLKTANSWEYFVDLIMARRLYNFEGLFFFLLLLLCTLWYSSVDHYVILKWGKESNFRFEEVQDKVALRNVFDIYCDLCIILRTLSMRDPNAKRKQNQNK